MAELMEDNELLPDHFELDRCCEFIDSGSYNRVALQLPSELIRFATFLSQELQRKTKSQIFLLGDSAYHSCCVDEIQADKLAVDSIIHFGNACFSQTSRIPTLFIFNEIYIDHLPLATAVRKYFEDKNIPILLLYHTNCTKLALRLYSILSTEYPNLECSHLVSSKKEGLADLNDVILGRKTKVNCLNDNFRVLYVGERDRTCLNFRLTYHTNRFYQLSPGFHAVTELCNEDKLLKKRYYLMQNVDKASIIGILVGNLWIRDYLHILSDMKKYLRQKRKEYYTISVGNIQPNKLANFLEVDIFVLLGCPENPILDSREFYKPIITPYELYLSLSESHCSVLSGNYQINLKDMFESISITTEEESTESPNPELNASETQLQLKQEHAVQSREVFSAAAFLRARSWQGLDAIQGSDSHSLVEEGKSGLPIRYSNEPIQVSPSYNPNTCL